MLRKDAVITKERTGNTDGEKSEESGGPEMVKRLKKVVTVEHVDIIGDNFWDQNPGFLDQ